MLTAGFIFASLLAAIVNAAPGFKLQSKRQGITPLSSAQISVFTPFTHFASTAYCTPNTTIDWSCGENCVANSDFIPTASGGDGGSVQYWYVGFSPSQATVVVAHQGTDISKIQADATDLELFLEPLDPLLFPGIDPFIECHSGFAREQAKTAADILSAVQATIVAHKATQVTIVGHSLGAAISLIDAVYLPLHIEGVSFKMIGYGLPRVGNQAFADYVDAHLSVASVTHINNKKDFIPIILSTSLGYVHPSGEVHIMENNEWVSCPGQDNPSTECVVGDVPNVFEGNLNDHDGPYNGITMGC